MIMAIPIRMMSTIMCVSSPQKEAWLGIANIQPLLSQTLILVLASNLTKQSTVKEYVLN